MHKARVQILSRPTTDRQRDRQAERERKRERERERQTDRQTDRQREKAACARRRADRCQKPSATKGGKDDIR